MFSKSYFTFLKYLITVLVFTSCNISKKNVGKLIGLEDSYIKFGGESWKLKTDENFDELIIINSESLNKAGDSLTYHLISICREYIKNYPNHNKWLQISMKSQGNIGLATVENAIYSQTFNLKVIEEMEELSITEVLNFLMALKIVYELSESEKVDKPFLIYLSDEDNDPSSIIARSFQDLKNLDTNLANSRMIKLYDLKELQHGKIYELMGVFFYETKNFEYAKNSFQKASHQLINTNILNGLATSYYKLQKLDSAIIYFSKLIQQEPTNIEALGSRASCYNEIGQVDNCCKDVYQILSINPDIELPKVDFISYCIERAN